jgi:Ca2+-binding RTX toxin-like protein
VVFTFSKPVSHLEFDAGFFNQAGSTIIRVFDSHGNLLQRVKNTVDSGFQHFTFDFTDIGRVKVLSESNEDAGFALDNLSFVNQAPKVQMSSVQDIDGILWGYKWDHKHLTFSFPTSQDEYTHNGYASINGFSSLNAQQMHVYRDFIIPMFSGVCGLEFTETNSVNADIRFGQALQIDYSDGQGAHTPGLGNGTAEGIAPDPDHATVSWGDIWFSTNPGGNNNSNPQPGEFYFAAAFMHELGHALGLKHGHATQDAHGDTFPKLPADHDSQEYSIMTYSTYPGTQGPATDYPTTLMQDDIAALQYIYGADFKYHAGDTVYSWDPVTGELSINDTGQGAPVNAKVFMTVWDGNGIDTFDLSNYTTRVKINLQPGEWTITSEGQLADLGDGHSARGNVATALLFNDDPRSLIENAQGGSGNDRIQGNQAGNILRGNDGRDVLFGKDGDDTLLGGRGADTLLGGKGHDTYKFVGAIQSTSTTHDTVEGFNALTDKFFVPVSVTGVDSDVNTGTLSVGSFDANLSAAVGAGKLGVHHAVLFTPDAGALADQTFLIVDVNGVAGYQANGDLVVQMVGASNLLFLTTSNFA